jgi:hypothetical protein
MQLCNGGTSLMSVETNMDNLLQGWLVSMRLWPRLLTISDANPRVCAGSRPFHLVFGKVR